MEFLLHCSKSDVNDIFLCLSSAELAHLNSCEPSYDSTGYQNEVSQTCVSFKDMYTPAQVNAFVNGALSR